jgi:hypothetical protein
VFAINFRLKDWYIIVPLGLVALALGTWGFASCSAASAHPTGLIGLASVVGMALAKTVGLIFLRGMGGDTCVRPQSWQLAVAQFMLPAVALFGGAKLFLADLRSDVRVAMAQRAHDHVIVCGLGDIGRQIVENLRAADRTVVAITDTPDDANAFYCEGLGVAVLKADPAQADILRHAGVKRASAIVTTTGSDAKNLEIGLRAAEAQDGRRRAPLKVLAQVRSGWLMDRLLSDRTAVLSSPGVDFQVFNLQVDAARALLRSSAFERTFGGAAQTHAPHIVVAGFGSVANEFVLRAVCSAFAAPGLRPRFAIFDENAGEAEARLRQRAPGLLELADFAFHTCHFGVGDSAAPLAIKSHMEQADVDAVVVALADDEDALHTAFHYRATLDKRERLAVPVFVRLKAQHKLGDFLRQVESHPLLPDRFAPFGDLRDLTSPAVLLDGALDRMARAVHAIYLEHQPTGAVSPANVPWERLPEIFKASNRDVADHIAAGLRSAGYRLTPAAGPGAELDAASVETLAQAEHWRWLLERRAAGWTYAEERNDALLRSPALLEWDQVDEGSRNFNRAFARQIPKIVARAGQGVTRERLIMLGRSPEQDVAAITPDALTVLVVDPLVEAHWLVAARCVAERGARVRLRWRGAKALAAIGRRAEFAALLPAFEGWVSAKRSGGDDEEGRRQAGATGGAAQAAGGAG